MLVSSIARLSAMNTMNSAAFATMQSTSNLYTAMHNAKTFGGEYDLSMLNQMDKNISQDLASNSLSYKIAYLQEKMLSKLQKNKLNVLA
jgi:hypothetical protein